MAMACLGLVTFFPLRPDFSLPSFIARISRSTFLLAEGEYLRPEDFFELDLLELDFFEADPRVLFFALLPRVLFLALPDLLLREERLELPREELLREVREREDPLFEPLDFFLAAFFVAMTILLGGQMAGRLRQVACRSERKVASQCRRAVICGYTMRRMTGMRTSGSAMSHVAMQLSVPVMANLRIAGATNE